MFIFHFHLFFKKIFQYTIKMVYSGQYKENI